MRKKKAKELRKESLIVANIYNKEDQSSKIYRKLKSLYNNKEITLKGS